MAVPREPARCPPSPEQLYEVFQAMRSRAMPPATPQEALLRAAADGEASRVKELLQENADIDLNAFHLLVHLDESYTALQLAALYGHLEVSRVMVEAGARVNIKTKRFGDTALHIAVEQGYPAVVEYLLSKGANPLALGWKGATPLSLAREHATGATGRTKPEDAANAKRCEELLEAAAGKVGTKPLEETHRRLDGCGACAAKGTKLQACSGCGLQWYCGRDCQTRDWPKHRARCKQAKEMRAAIAEACDLSLDPWARMGSGTKLDGRRELAVRLKAVKRLLAVLPEDQPFWLVDRPAIVAIRCLRALMDDGNNFVPDPEATAQFLDNGGLQLVFECINQPERGPHIMLEGARLLSAVTDTWQAPRKQAALRNAIRAGLAIRAVEAAPPLVVFPDDKVLANTAVVLSRLCYEEGLMAREEGREGLQPIAAAVLAKVDILHIAKAAGRRPDTETGSLQAGVSFFHALAFDKATVDGLLADPELAHTLANDFTFLLFQAAEECWTTALDFLRLVIQHRPDFVSGPMSQALGSWVEVNPLEDQPVPSRDNLVACILDMLDSRSSPPTSTRTRVPINQGPFVATNNVENACVLIKALVTDCPPLRKAFKSHLKEVRQFVAAAPRASLNNNVMARTLLHCVDVLSATPAAAGPAAASHSASSVGGRSRAGTNRGGSKAKRGGRRR
ncbi:hypothetical protein WJX72_006772 [[Myrmecia] bisecta]|uniref:MYND-type domain-containing protein n=1 Tax=[Myrmecia] bisecta TaxID=41462 RepID=A0AAW1P3J5_9CHLO